MMEGPKQKRDFLKERRIEGGGVALARIKLCRLKGVTEGELMVILMERQITSKADVVLKNLARILGKTAIFLRQLERELTIISFSEGYFEEGTSADREFVRKKLEELQSLISELDEVNLLFNQEDIQSSFNEKQSALNKAMDRIMSIRSNMLSIWSMRNSGGSVEDNEKIQYLINKLFKNINDLIREIKVYVTEFNQNSVKKLKFNVKWTSLPK